MHADLVLVLLVIVFGCAAFLFGLVYIVGSVVGMIGRGFWGLVRPSRRLRGGRGVRIGGIAVGAARTCAVCGNVDARVGRFCGRCGAKMSVNRSSRSANESNWWWMG